MDFKNISKLLLLLIEEHQRDNSEVSISIDKNDNVNIKYVSEEGRSFVIGGDLDNLENVFNRTKELLKQK